VSAAGVAAALCNVRAVLHVTLIPAAFEFISGKDHAPVSPLTSPLRPRIVGERCGQMSEEGPYGKGRT
jgi:hypothetical protein